MEEKKKGLGKKEKRKHLKIVKTKEKKNGKKKDWICKKKTLEGRYVENLRDKRNENNDLVCCDFMTYQPL